MSPVILDDSLHKSDYLYIYYGSLLMADLYSRVMKVKTSAPGTKVLLAIGGASAGTGDFETISVSSIYRKWFAEHAVVYLRQYGFDGLDVDWQFPSASYKAYFTLFLEVSVYALHKKEMELYFTRLTNVTLIC